MATPSQIHRYFSKPVIPVLWNVGSDCELIALASSVILQGGTIAELTKAVDCFAKPPLDHLRLLVHIDLVAGLEKNEAGLEFLAGLGKVDGVVTVHHHLAAPAKRLGFLSIIRMFLSDSRALERGLQVAAKTRTDVIEFLPATAAVKVADKLSKCSIPYIAGGLCLSDSDVRETLASGSLAVSSTRPELWHMNRLL